MVPALVPEREREHREHDKHHAHSDSFARMVQTMITHTATFLAAGTSIGRARFIPDEIGGLNQRWALPAAAAEVAAESENGGADAVSVLGRRAIRIDENVVGRVRART